MFSQSLQLARVSRRTLARGASATVKFLRAGDLDADGEVGGDDLQALLGTWGDCD